MYDNSKPNTLRKTTVDEQANGDTLSRLVLTADYLITSGAIFQSLKETYLFDTN